MTITNKLSPNGEILIIDVGEKFDFLKVKDFKNAYSDLNTSVNTIEINMAKTEYMDSSALGMLLNMQKIHADKALHYKITHCNAQVARILQISRFDKKFEISKL
jgi:anti-anti-sigma factor